MNLSDNGLRMIVDFEGKHRALGGGRYAAYRCPAGVWTIYAGVTEGIREGMVCTEAEGETMFRRELAKHEHAVERLTTVELNQNEFDALVSFSYNCGTGALAKSTLLRKLNSGDREGAARAFAAWNKGGGRVLPGLVRRRAAEAALFRKPAEVSAEPDMPQQVDAPATRPESSRIMATAGVGEKTAATLSIGGVLLWIIDAFRLNDALGFAGQILPLVKDYGSEAFILVMLALAAGFALVKHFRQQDHQDGKTAESAT